MNKWVSAQKYERTHHPHPFDASLTSYSSNFYRNFYENYFKFTGLEYDLKGKTVIEVGPAKIAGLCFCENYGKSYLVEPIIYEDTLEFYKSKGITMIHEPAETCDLPKVDQAWMFNLLQHVIDPHTVIEKLKGCADEIYFFEPLDVPVDEKHIHSPNRNLFINEFGKDVVKIYKGRSVRGFHYVDCAYGKFIVNG